MLLTVLSPSFFALIGSCDRPAPDLLRASKPSHVSSSGDLTTSRGRPAIPLHAQCDLYVSLFGGFLSPVLFRDGQRA